MLRNSNKSTANLGRIARKSAVFLIFKNVNRLPKWKYQKSSDIGHFKIRHHQRGEEARADRRFNQMIDEKPCPNHAKKPTISRNIEAIHHAIRHALHKLITILSVILMLMFGLTLPKWTPYVAYILGDAPTAIHGSIICNKLVWCSAHANTILKIGAPSAKVARTQSLAALWTKLIFREYFLTVFTFGFCEMHQNNEFWRFIKTHW